MANISYDFVEIPRGGEFKNSVGFFSLKNDGDDAIVRILHNSVDDFVMMSCHTIEMDGKYRKINCLRGPRDPMQMCPLCEAGAGKLQQRMFIYLLHYVKDENGNIVVLPKIWERSVAFAKTIKGLIDEYGPLEKRVFKIRRQGAAGSMQTTYTVLPQDSAIYPEAQFPIDKSGFDGYNVLGTLVMNKSYEECVSFVRTGSFPQREKSDNEVKSADWGTAPQFNQAIPRQSVPTTPKYEPVESTITTTTPYGAMPWDSATQTNQFSNPPRRYN